MTNFIASNLTKYRTGFTGVAQVEEGFIKSVEKVWMDTFSFTSALTTADTLAIATIPKNNRITGVEIYLPVYPIQTEPTLHVGISSSTSLFVSSATITISNNIVPLITMNNPAGFSYVTTQNEIIYLSFGTDDLGAPTIGTIKTIVRYT